ncbi:MAG: transketolase [Candidatus Poribacteria bacterium]|nr:transketolase [Candidatus Poribacteria bacterium]
MRNAFAEEIARLAATDERIALLSGDIGNRLFDPYKAQFPERFFNCGVAEANLIGTGAGMAMCGMRPVGYTIVPFITTRCLEQIRVDLCYHRLPMVIVGVGGGMSYASLGATHHSCEDIAFMRVLPGMTVICPGDSHEVRGAVRAALQLDGPSYIRIGKKGEPLVHETEPDFKIGKGIVVREGTDVCLLATGNILPVAVEAGEALAAQGVSARVVSFHTVKPLDDALLRESFERFRVVATVEEHSVLGGLGGSVAEWMTDQQNVRARLCRIGTPDEFLHVAGEQEYARECWNLTTKGIAEQTLRALGASSDRSSR